MTPARRIALPVCLAALLCAACAPEGASSPRDAASPAAATDAPPAAGPADPAASAAGGSAGIQPGLKWDAQVSGAGYALVLTDAAGAPLLRVACTRDPARLLVRAEQMNPVGSEERLSFGLDDEPYALVADSTAPGPGVSAEGPIPPDLLERLPSANSVSVSYGSQTLGPHMPPAPEQARPFVAACRQLAAR